MDKRARWSIVILAGTSVLLALFALGRAGMLPTWVAAWAWLGKWWPALVSAAFAGGAFLVWRRRRPFVVSIAAGPQPSDRAGRWSQFATLITALTALGALVFTALSLQATREQIHVAEQGQITDRYTRAIDQLGTPGPEHLQVRLGGIFALERLAADSPRDRKTIAEVLTAFVRATSPRVQETACPPIAADVQAAFVVLARREVTHQAFSAGQLPLIDLRDTCLVGLQAPNSDLTGFGLSGADLTGADLYAMRAVIVGLKDTVLAGAVLSESDLTGLAVLEGADLTGAELAGATFGRVVLTDVSLADADLRGADLGRAHLVRVDLTGALHDRATVTTMATYDDGTTGAWWG